MRTIIAAALAASIAFALAGCMSSADKDTQRERDFNRTEDALEAAQRAATVSCRDASQCDKAWALTHDYIAQRSATSIVSTSSETIDTDVPGGSGKATFSATRVPHSGGATITLYAQCRGMYGPNRAMGSDYDDCARKIVATQNGFPRFLSERIAAGSK
ncbi:hypothetical protein [Paraburkholderia sp. SUR17]|uniref:hypothetical protein n=1 Tax=Paraburkholderia sp. SUR17 TaxID=3034358 RepID=UPI002407E545|nr:hypothetical protein [Paraburkholderia sp. SUR17]WEY39882.1 hypothetical protein P2869_05855 [Paraburkholderia sp. SUR17]